VQIVTQHRVSGAGDEQRVPRRVRVVAVAGQSAFLGRDESAQLVVALHQRHRPSGLRQLGRGDQAVDAGTDDDRGHFGAHRTPPAGARSMSTPRSRATSVSCLRTAGSRRTPSVRARWYRSASGSPGRKTRSTPGAADEAAMASAKQHIRSANSPGSRNAVGSSARKKCAQSFGTLVSAYRPATPAPKAPPESTPVRTSTKTARPYPLGPPIGSSMPATAAA